MWHHERRWKTRRNIYASDLSTVLNNLSAQGWSIYSIMPQSAYRYVIVANRNVKVYEKS